MYVCTLSTIYRSIILTTYYSTGRRKVCHRLWM
jgi:hypothetical protein